MPLDSVIRANGNLAEIARACIGVHIGQQGVQHFFIFAGNIHNASLFYRQAYLVKFIPVHDGGIGKGDIAVNPILYRRGKNFAVREIGIPAAVNPFSACHVHENIRILRKNMQFLLSIQIACPFFLPCRHFLPFCNRIFLVKIACGVNEILIFLQAHACILGIPVGRELCAAPAQLTRSHAFGINLAVVLIRQTLLFQSLRFDGLHGLCVFATPCADPDIAFCAGTKTNIFSGILLLCPIFQKLRIHIGNVNIIFHQRARFHCRPCDCLDKRQCRILCGNSNAVAFFHLC